jgi:hypothetical protein
MPAVKIILIIVKELPIKANIFTEVLLTFIPNNIATINGASMPTAGISHNQGVS